MSRVTIYSLDIPRRRSAVHAAAQVRAQAEASALREESESRRRACFFHDPEDVGNLISGSSAFSISLLLGASVRTKSGRGSGRHMQLLFRISEVPC